ncbi:hypothetical protein NW754_016569 [Fusarium falciforme]|uniref:Uncharacterized protein n=1 Tax=Fusarium falciforme TaxID=195108 RepID=A0A9W8UWZ3_9HYPO|nr:hypothetical protein NW754_016569 [Fusarium falciforme]KAJ4184186.1 hypothetical protein NW755_009192 [Fusarium falciforme]KAJ4187833.1 hypothetical protein NW767_012108 [Fusarium falciforme]KAJ4259467.1 hypothetical protein NW757_002790 [Fusarium falciforme]
MCLRAAGVDGTSKLMSRRARPREMRDMGIRWSRPLFSWRTRRIPKEPPDITCIDLMGSLMEHDRNRAPTTSGKAMGMGRLVRVHPLDGVEQIARLASHVC